MLHGISKKELLYILYFCFCFAVPFLFGLLRGCFFKNTGVIPSHKSNNFTLKGQIETGTDFAWQGAKWLVVSESVVMVVVSGNMFMIYLEVDFSS